MSRSPSNSTGGRHGDVIDPAGLLLRLALCPDGEADLTAQELKAARQILCGPGGLAYAYRVLDDVALLREAHGAAPIDDHDAPHHSALTALLLDETLDLDDATGLATPPQHLPLGQTLRAFFLRTKGLFAGGGLVAAAAALALFVYPSGPIDDVPSQPLPPGVKALHHEGLVPAPFVVDSLKVLGPLSSDLVLEGLSQNVRELMHCAERPARFHLAFTVTPQGLVSKVVVDGVAQAQGTFVERCLSDVVTHTAFAFQEVVTEVSLDLERTEGLNKSGSLAN